MWRKESSVAAREKIGRLVMGKETETEVYVHYNHDDSCKHARWTARECYQFMYARPWQQVLDFYSSIVNRRSSLSALLRSERPSFSKETALVEDVAEVTEDREETELVGVSTKCRTGRWARVTFKILLSYHGGSFDGWQKQPSLNTVQGLVEKSIGSFVDEKKAQKLKEKSLPLEGCAIVAGRTDKGVTALKQVCAFYTWRKDVQPQNIEDAINSAAPGKLRVISVSQVSREFHPNFSAKWRRYFYIFPLNNEEEEQISENEMDKENPSCHEQHHEQINGCALVKDEEGECCTFDDCDNLETGRKPRSFCISTVSQLLLQLEGKSLSYKMFARDTKASRSSGPPTECFIYHARAIEARLPCLEEVHGGSGEGLKVMCVELVANRFLRKMVRVLVATSVREAAAGAANDALLRLMDATCRRATAPPAPPHGLCLVDVGYSDFSPEICFIK